MTELSEKLARLSPEQMRALAEKLREQRKAGTRQGIPIQSRDNPDFPLSFSQQRLWFLSQLAPQSVAYNNPVAARFRVAGGRRLDPVLLSEAFDELMARHESLRSTFLLVDGEPRQRIRQNVRLPLRYLELEAAPEAERLDRAMSILREDTHKPFDLESGPLIRATVVKVDEGDYLFLINTHHLVSDAWSIGVLLREFGLIVMARGSGLPSMLPALPVQYVDFAAWQRQQMRGETYERLVRYWTDKLALPLPVLRLPAPIDVNEREGTPGRTVRHGLSAGSLGQLKELAKEHGTTLFVVLLSAFKWLLHVYAREHDIVVGTPVANRTRVEIEGLIGCFINTLVLRTDLVGATTFAELLARVGQTANDAFAHQDMPFELLVNELQPQRNLRSNPLFQTLFSLQNAPLETGGMGGMISLVDFDDAAAKFDLTLTAMETDGRLSLAWSYRTDLIDGEAIVQMSRHYVSLLEAVLDSPHAPLRDLPMLDEPGRALLDAWCTSVNPTSTRAELNYLDMFEASARQHAEAIAVQQEDLSFSYRQLHAAAIEVARRLGKAGIGKDDTVAMLLPRSPAWLAGALGAMMAGAAFLPLDPAWPGQRIVHILDKARAGAMLTDSALSAQVDTQVPNIVLDESLWHARHEAPGPEACARHRRPDALAYVIFTSGSTGEPKGVAIEHRHLCRYVENIAGRMELPPRASYLAVSTLAADLAYTMIFPALANGGRLLLASPAQMAEPERLARWLNDHPADAMKIVPSHLDSLLEISDPDRLLPRTLLMLGGESCPPALLAKLGTLRSGLRVMNHYGPTETTVGVIAGAMTGAMVSSGTPIVLGTPLGDARIYICDDDMRLLPPGALGELCIGGPTVARGYLSDDSPNAFVTDPFAPDSAARLYRSGDLARWQSDGRVQFLGRMDHQVKIRGFRVEPAEVEATIASWPGARAAAVKPVGQGADVRLAAWVVAADETADVTALRRWLRDRLPDALQPAYLSFVGALPLTNNGKIDRQALPEPMDDGAREVPFVAPRTPLELQVARLWEGLLARERVGMHDNFFDMGGHSLLAVRLVAQVQKIFGISVPLMALFAHPTVESFARRLQQPASQEGHHALVPIQVGGTRKPLFFVHPAGGNVMCYYQLARSLGTEQPFYGLQARMFDTGRAGSIAGMAREYIEAMRSVQPVGPYRIGGWSMGGVVAFEVARQLREAGDSVEWLAILDIPAPGTISHGDRDRIDEASALRIYASKAELFSGADLGTRTPGIESWDAHRLGEHLLQAMQRAALLPAEVTAEQFRLFMDVQKAHNYASLNYRPGTYDGPVTVIRCEDPPPVQLEAELLGLEAVYANDALGWDAFVKQPPIVHRIAGNHVQMMVLPHVEEIAQIIRTDLV